MTWRIDFAPDLQEQLAQHMCRLEQGLALHSELTELRI